MSIKALKKAILLSQDIANSMHVSIDEIESIKEVLQHLDRAYWELDLLETKKAAPQNGAANPEKGKLKQGLDSITRSVKFGSAEDRLFAHIDSELDVFEDLAEQRENGIVPKRISLYVRGE